MSVLLNNLQLSEDALDNFRYLSETYPTLNIHECYEFFNDFTYRQMLLILTLSEQGVDVKPVLKQLLSDISQQSTVSNYFRQIDLSEIEMLAYFVNRGKMLNQQKLSVSSWGADQYNDEYYDIANQAFPNFTMSLSSYDLEYVHQLYAVKPEMLRLLVSTCHRYNSSRLTKDEFVTIIRILILPTILSVMGDDRLLSMFYDMLQDEPQLFYDFMQFMMRFHYNRDFEDFCHIMLLVMSPQSVFDVDWNHKLKDFHLSHRFTGIDMIREFAQRKGYDFSDVFTKTQK